jgi:6-phosphogluconate dehydrogenase
MQSDIGLIGLAVMGQNLALNIADHGFAISVYNRTTDKTDEFVKENPNTPGEPHRLPDHGGFRRFP